MTPTLLGRLARWTDAPGYALRAVAPRPFKGRGRVLRAWRAARPRGDVRTRVLPGGGRLELDLSVPYEAHVWVGVEEPHDLEVLRALLRPGDVVVDCGANLGLWALTAAAAAGEEGAVLAVEPNPTTAARLRRNVARSGAVTVRVAEAAAGATRGVVPFVCDAEHNVSHVAAPGTAGAVEVPQAPLDALAARHIGDRPIALVKVDVEGHELEALEGAAGLVAASRPLLCVEFNTIAAGVATLGRWPVHALLSGWGYEPVRFVDALDPAAPAVGPDEPMTGYLNLLYRPRP